MVKNLEGHSAIRFFFIFHRRLRIDRRDLEKGTYDALRETLETFSDSCGRLVSASL
jgi:hypothetical protein